MSYLNRTNLKYQSKPTVNKYKNTVIFGVVLLALFVFVIWFNIRHIPLKEKIYTKVDSALHEIFAATLDINVTLSKISHLKDYLNLHEKYITLQEENLHLKTLLKSLNHVSEENKALKQLNKFVSGKGILIASGNLAVKSPDAFSKEIRLLAGTNHKIKEGQIVLDKRGLLGRITNVGPNISSVLLITDPISKVPVIFPRIGNKGILSGSYDNNLEISLLDKETLPEPQDVVITSGDGGFFPPGLIVGTVLSNGSDGEIKVKPLFDINKLNFVSVIEY